MVYTVHVYTAIKLGIRLILVSARTKITIYTIYIVLVYYTSSKAFKNGAYSVYTTRYSK